MEHPNEAVAQRLWSAIAAGDAESLGDLLSPAVLWRSMGASPLSGEYLGTEAVLGYMASIGERADELVSRMDTVYVNDEGAVIVYDTVARRSGRTLEMKYFLQLRIEGEIVVSGRSVPFDQATNDAFWS